MMMIAGKLSSFVFCFERVDDTSSSGHPGKSDSDSEEAWVTVVRFLSAISLL